MARFRTDGIDAIIQQMKDLQELSGDVANEMLMAGAEEAKKAWIKSAEMHGLRLTSQMINAIGYAGKPSDIKGIKSIDVYPIGKSNYTESPDGKRIKRKKPVRLAEIAFILHYGSSKIRQTHWVDDADELSEEPVTRVMTEIWEDFLKEKGT